MQNQNLTLIFSTEEVNTILQSLGNMPYIKVVQIINKIQEQAAQQINGSSKTTTEQPPESAANGASKTKTAKAIVAPTAT